MVRAELETQLVLLTRKASAHDKRNISPRGCASYLNQLAQTVQKGAAGEVLPAYTALAGLPLFADEVRRGFDDLRDDEVRRDDRECVVERTVERGAVNLSRRLNDRRTAAVEFTAQW
jgi:hypothetical protein